MREYDFTINERRRNNLTYYPDYHLTDSLGNETALIFERRGAMRMVFAKTRDINGIEREMGGAMTYSFEDSVKVLFGGKYLPFLKLQIPSETVK